MEILFAAIALLILITLVFLAMRVKRPEAVSPDEMSGTEFEVYAAEILERAGYEILQLTKAGGDYGADIIIEKDGEKIAVQCKRYEKPVGVSAVQQAAASKAHYSCRTAAVFTNSTFTKQAKTLAAELGVILWGREQLEAFDCSLSAASKGYRPKAPVTVAPVVSQRSFECEIYLDDGLISQGVFAKPAEAYVTLDVHTLTVFSKRRKSALTFAAEDAQRLVFAVGERKGKPFVYQLINK